MIIKLYRKKPWILVVAAFLILITAWSTLIFIAVNNQPEKLEVTPEAETHD